MKELNLEGFKNGEVCVFCKNDSKKREFLNYCENNGLRLNKKFLEEYENVGAFYYDRGSVDIIRLKSANKRNLVEWTN